MGWGQNKQKRIITSTKLWFCGCIVLIFLLTPALLSAKEFSWNAQFNHYTEQAVVEGGIMFPKNSEFSRVRTFVVESGEGVKNATLRFTDTDGEERASVAFS